MSLGRVVLKAHTKMSLNDRFTILRRDNPSKVKDDQDIATRRHDVQTTRRNQRIAAQMERRPAVIKALNLKSDIQTRINGQPKLTVKQRLFNPKQRLQTTTSPRGRGFIRGRGLRGARGATRGIMRGRGQASRLFANRISPRGGRGRISSNSGSFSSPTRGRSSRGTIRGRGRRPFNRASR